MEDDMSGFSKLNKMDPDEYYKTDEGFIVFTEKHHLKRGHCCKNNCRHCPYGYNPKSGQIKK